MIMAADMAGHLDCMFDCGLKFSSLESLYLHVELDHREDNTISPFAIQKLTATQNENMQPGQLDRNLPDHQYHHPELPYQDGQAPPPLPARAPPAVPLPPPNGTSRGKNDASEDEPFVLCPQKECGELILITELNEHLDLHEAEDDIINDQNPSLSTPTPQLHVGGKHFNNHISSLSTVSSSSSSRFTTQIDPALRRKMEPHVHEDDSSRTHMGRKFLSIFSLDKRTKARVPSNAIESGNKRLGTAELGPYAYEDRMPSWMHKRLKEGPKVLRTKRVTRNGGLVTHESIEGQTNGVLPILRRLVEMDEDVYKSYLCHPSVTQVGKTTWESGFCGFRNTQMIISYIQNSKHIAHTLFPGQIPGILELQDWIEDAWLEGINEYAKIEFGGLRGTRKWIGTLEVHTLFEHLGIKHKIHQFHDTLHVNNRYAEQNLLDWVEMYFKNGTTETANIKVQCTLKPPIYFQRPGHSLTIVGIERMRNGSRNLLVFDPMYQTPKSMIQLIERGDRRIKASPSKLLRFYRRSQHRLEHYLDFEATTLEGDLPLFPAWDVIEDYDSPEVLAFFESSSHSYELFPRDMFGSAFPWEFFGSLFNIQEARFMPTPFCQALPRICVPQVWSREQGAPPPYESYLRPQFVDQKSKDGSAIDYLITTENMCADDALDVAVDVWEDKTIREYERDALGECIESWESERLQKRLRSAKRDLSDTITDIAAFVPFKFNKCPLKGTPSKGSAGVVLPLLDDSPEVRKIGGIIVT